jgi:aminopeptidase N
VNISKRNTGNFLARFNIYILITIFSTGVASAQLFAVKTYNRADTLRGMLSPERTCYDVTFYELDIRVNPELQTIRGSNKIHFNVDSSFERMQLDLDQNLKIDQIIDEEGETLLFQREFAAVFITLPKKLKKGSMSMIEVFYSGKPVVAKRPPWQGGFTWEHDKEGNPWVVVTCQGDGASLWWPNKDHQSDEPDSMRISITVPAQLENISNGRLRNKTVLADGWTRFDWFVSYPINNYCVTLNIGNFAHFRDYYINQGDTVSLDYYVMPENEDKARMQFQQVRAMMACFEHFFGPYPFPRDGYKLIESPHNGMEHQTAIAYGNRYRNGYLGKSSSAIGLKFDFIIVHESAHEWWGNSVTANDLADMWIHESFGAYAEALYVEYFYGYPEALRYINGRKQGVHNDRPIIGPYHVNTSGSGDMYNKGQLILNTLRHVIANDSLWFAIIKGLQETYKYQCIDGNDVFDFINKQTGRDYNYFFEQYFRRVELPELSVNITNINGQSTAVYKWHSEVKDFRMPIKVTTARDHYDFIYPTTEPQNLSLGSLAPEDFKIAGDLFYVNLNLKWSYQISE